MQCDGHILIHLKSAPARVLCCLGVDTQCIILFCPPYFFFFEQATATF